MILAMPIAMAIAVAVAMAMVLQPGLCMAIAYGHCDI